LQVGATLRRSCRELLHALQDRRLTLLPIPLTKAADGEDPYQVFQTGQQAESAKNETIKSIVVDSRQSLE
jgi:hypothetical protein